MDLHPRAFFGVGRKQFVLTLHAGTQNAFLVKRKDNGGTHFSRDPLNLTNVHTRTVCLDMLQTALCTWKQMLILFLARRFRQREGTDFLISEGPGHATGRTRRPDELLGGKTRNKS